MIVRGPICKKGGFLTHIPNLSGTDPRTYDLKASISRVIVGNETQKSSLSYKLDLQSVK